MHPQDHIGPKSHHLSLGAQRLLSPFRIAAEGIVMVLIHVMPLSEMREAAGDPVSVVVILLSLVEDGLCNRLIQISP